MAKKNENTAFVCENCGKYVKALTNGSIRNHCPFCLFSKHVDNLPGDRACDCRGMMKPVAIELSPKKGQQIVHRCLKCGAEKLNKVAEDTEQNDNVKLILDLMRERGKRC